MRYGLAKRLCDDHRAFFLSRAPLTTMSADKRPNPSKLFVQHWQQQSCDHSGPVLRDTARLSQRYPPIARYGVFRCLNMADWVRYPLPLF